MISAPKITVITPTFNQAVFIERTILSVLNQNYPNLEYLVFDAGSNDGTLEILKKYSDSLTWFSEPDHGQTDAINKGLRLCTGDVITFLNSDDEFAPGALGKVGEYFLAHPQIAWVTGKCQVIDQQDVEVLKLVTLYKNLLLRTHSSQLLKIVNFISQPATFWRRKVLDEIGYMDETLEYVMDYDYWLRITCKYPISFLDEVLAKFRTYPASKTRQSAINQQDEEFRVVHKYSRSAPLRFIHSLHRLFNIVVYTWIFRSQ
jgi:glycosyltransferase involved in cell wall biosynthesis